MNFFTINGIQGEIYDAQVSFLTKVAVADQYLLIDHDHIGEIPLVYDKGEWAIAKQEITDEHRMAALSILSYMNMIKRKVEQDALADL